jgi:1,4-dihydroxy-6-naphthoate synthase
MKMEEIRLFDSYFRNSILYSLKNFDTAVDFAIRYGRGQSKDLIARFIKMYVNDTTIDMGDRGQESLKRMFAIAKERGILSIDQLHFV